MFTIQQYKPFHNSKDFEYLFVKSHADILKSYPLSIKEFKADHIDRAINNKTILIGYENDKPVGYQFINIKNRVLNSSFTFIDSNYRKKGYGSILRSKTYEIFKDKFDKISVCVYNHNYPSMISCQKLANKLGLNFKQDKVLTDKNHNPIAKIFNIFLNE